MNLDHASIYTIAMLGNFDQFKCAFDKSLLDVQDDDKSTVLHAAIAGKNTDIAEYLIDAGANVDIPDGNGQTSLHYIATEAYQNTDLATKLLQHTKNINKCDRWGNNPLWTAVFACKVHGYKDSRLYNMVQLFITFGADPLNKNKVDKSPLDIAILSGNQKLINILLKK